MTSAELPELPVDFRWGTSTSAYQIEGAVDVDRTGARTSA